MLTRLEILRLSRGIEPGMLEIESGISRQHLLRMRKGEIEPRRDMIAAVVSAFRQITLEDIQPEDVVELSVEESGPWKREPRNRNTADVDQWRRERDAASALIDEMHTRPPEKWLDILMAKGRSDAVVRALIFEGRSLIDVRASAAELHFRVAAALGEHLAELRHEYRMTLIGRAWLEMANARRQLGAYENALAAVDEAERRFEGEPYATRELGRAWHCRGIILSKMNRTPEARRSLRRAVNIFAAVDDHVRIANVRIVEGNLFFESGDFDSAHDLWVSIVPVLKAAKQNHSLAVVFLNLGWCEIERGDPPAARGWLEQALHGFMRLRADYEVLRTQWSLGRVQALHENRSQGLRALAAVRDRLEARGLTLDAGMVNLDIVEALLLPPQKPAAAMRICASLPALFQRAGAKREAMKAVAYLAEAAAARTLRIADVRHVRTFLDRQEGEGQSFVAPGAA